MNEIEIEAHIVLVVSRHTPRDEFAPHRLGFVSRRKPEQLHVRHSELIEPKTAAFGRPANLDGNAKVALFRRDIPNIDETIDINARTLMNERDVQWIACIVEIT